MGDNQALRDYHRAAADYGRRAAESVGVRPTQVTIRVRLYSGPVGLSTSTLVGDESRVLDPRPKVSRAGQESSYFASGYAVSGSGDLIAGQYEIGPTTLRYPGGGYTVPELAPALSVNKVVTVILEGDGFDGAEEYRLVTVEGTRPHQAMMLVTATATP